jgi:two-component system sensor histidine kinase KdpD
MTDRRQRPDQRPRAAYRTRRRAVPAPFALVTGFAALFAVGTVAAGLHGRLPATGVLIAAAIVTGVVSFAAVPLAALPMGVIGWLTTVGFSRPPYAQLHLAGPLTVRAAVVLGLVAVAGAGAGLAYRSAGRYILVSMGAPAQDGQPRFAGKPGPDGIDARRRALGVLLAVAGLPLLTLVLLAVPGSLTLTDHLLIYLLAVVGLAVAGGFWAAVLAAVAASLLLNWFFTPPLHTFTIDRPQNLLALLLFVTVAVAVSSVVHLAARRAVQAAASREEATSLLSLAQTVLGGADTPAAVLGHLTATLGGHAELQEQVSGRWVRIAASGTAPDELAEPEPARIAAREDLALVIAGQPGPVAPGLVAGFAAQAAAALDRERLRTQAAQAEALAEGNRMRTALLAAVSHDLRTPLASIKAGVSSLRQTDVEWSAADRADLLATIEQNADRLDGLIGNLLDLSRLHTGSLQPFLRPVPVDEVAPVALRGLDGTASVLLAVPDGLPLLRADPGLLERVLANLFSNALRHSPAAQPPVLRARVRAGSVLLEVIDHGQGVPDGQKDAIFEPFQRFDGRKAGVGLGLAVAKGFTEAMGGTIAAADTPGGGLTIRVMLPAASTAAEPVLGGDP